MKQDAGTRQLWELTLLHLQVRVVVVALYHSLFHLNGVGEVLEEVVVIADGGALRSTSRICGSGVNGPIQLLVLQISSL